MSVRTRERGEDPSTPRFTFTINLFKTILIGLKLPTFLVYVWTHATDDIYIPFRCFFTGVIFTGVIKEETYTSIVSDKFRFLGVWMRWLNVSLKDSYKDALIPPAGFNRQLTGR